MGLNFNLLDAVELNRVFKMILETSVKRVEKPYVSGEWSSVIY